MRYLIGSLRLLLVGLLILFILFLIYCVFPFMNWRARARHHQACSALDSLGARDEAVRQGTGAGRVCRRARLPKRRLRLHGLLQSHLVC